MVTSNPVYKRISAAIDSRYPNNNLAHDYFYKLLVDYIEANIGPPHLAEEIGTRDEGKWWSCIWEAMLYRHLTILGYNLRGTVKRTGQNGPDFSFEHAGRIIWVEAVVPSPQGIPAAYLEPPSLGCVKRKPDSERVLRCTSVIADKQIKFAEYREKGVIGANDCTVIALNICRLSEWDPDGTGISQYPLSMEAVFPIGPLAVPITPNGKIDGPVQNMPRFAVRKESGTEIKTANFLSPVFAGISAVIQAHQRDMHEKYLILSTIHNPLAINKLPIGLFGERKEFIAERYNTGYHIRDVRPAR